MLFFEFFKFLCPSSSHVGLARQAPGCERKTKSNRNISVIKAKKRLPIALILNIAYPIEEILFERTNTVTNPNPSHSSNYSSHSP